MTLEGLKDLAIGGVSAVAVIWVLINSLKVAGVINAKYAPLLAIGLGVAVSVGNFVWPQVTALVVMGAGLGGLATWVYAGESKMRENAKEAAKTGEGL